MLFEKAGVVQGKGSLGGEDGSRLYIVLLEAISDLTGEEKGPDYVVTGHKRKHQKAAEPVSRLGRNPMVGRGLIEQDRLALAVDLLVQSRRVYEALDVF